MNKIFYSLLIIFMIFFSCIEQQQNGIDWKYSTYYGKVLYIENRLVSDSVFGKEYREFAITDKDIAVGIWNQKVEVGMHVYMFRSKGYWFVFDKEYHGE